MIIIFRFVFISTTNIRFVCMYFVLQHYIEEGVDHFFIFDDASRDGTRQALRCIDSSYYTFFNQTQFKGAGRAKLPQREVYARMYSELGVRDKVPYIVCLIYHR